MTRKVTDLSFTILDLEKSAFQRDYERFERQLIELCHYLDNGGAMEAVFLSSEGEEITKRTRGFMPLSNRLTLSEKMDFYSRIASAITAYLSDISYTPKDSMLIHFVLFKTIISNIFYLSCYENMDHILWNRGLMTADYRLGMQNETDLKYLLCCYTLNSKISVDYRLLYGALPSFGPYSYLGLLYGFKISFNERMENNHKHLIEIQDVLDTIALDATSFSQLCSAWMSCSYWDIDNRHKIKQTMNGAIERWLDRIVPVGTKKRVQRYVEETKTIKRIVVASEKYRHNHAMYRCYHSSIAALKGHYELILVSAPQDYDEISKADFDRVIDISDEPEQLAQTITEISKLQPDLIFYPSIGMAKWTIGCCNMRLAKYQVMSYGHPASAFSRHIDFGWVDGLPAEYDYQPFTLEKLAPSVGRLPVFTPYPEYNPDQQFERIEDGILRIAINSSLQKISRRVINMCNLLIAHSSVPLEFHFFMIENRDSQTTAFTKSLLTGLNGRFIVHAPQPYPDYMKQLAQCELSIGTFPFGGSNTNVDAALLGIPKIYYTEGSDLAAFADHVVWGQMDLPDIVHAKSEMELVSNLIYLIHNPKMRSEISNQIKRQDPAKILFQTKNQDADTSLLQMIENING